MEQRKGRVCGERGGAHWKVSFHEGPERKNLQERLGREDFGREQHDGEERGTIVGYSLRDRQAPLDKRGGGGTHRCWGLGKRHLRFGSGGQGWGGILVTSRFMTRRRRITT